MAKGVPEPHLSAWRAMLNAHASIVALIEAELAAADLPPLIWYDMLWAVRRAPGKRIRMAELAASLTVSRGGLTKLADRLEGAGLLTRERVEGDGRGLYAVIEPEGEALLRRMWPVYAKVVRDTFVAAIDSKDAARIAESLTRASASAQ